MTNLRLSQVARALGYSCPSVQKGVGVEGRETVGRQEGEGATWRQKQLIFSLHLKKHFTLGTHLRGITGAGRENKVG